MLNVRMSFTALTLATLFAFAVPRIQAQDEPNPIAAKVKESVKDSSKPFVMLVSLQVKEGANKKFESAFARATKPTLKERGCIRYELSQDPNMPSKYLVYERWQNLKALENHLKSKHITTLLMEVGEMLEGPPEIRVMVPSSKK